MIKQAEDQDEGQAGSIINLSSIAARRTQPELLGYSVASAALDQMTRSMAVALAPAPDPGECGRLRFGHERLAARRSEENTANTAKRSRHTRRWAGSQRPTELADAVQFLASESSGFMTGQIMTVDGGRTLLDPVAAPAH